MRKLLIVGSLVLLGGCSSVPDQTAVEDEGDPRDPLESINRPIYNFNMNVLDKYLLRPASVFYRDYIPSPVRTGLHNASDNLSEPASAVNNLLQGNGQDSLRNLGRFLVNSTFGVVGVFDVAQMWGVPAKQDKFGEVLGSYGIGNGPYLMLPGMGPTTLRDTSGKYVDSAYWPLAAFAFWPTIVKAGLDGLHSRAALLDQEKLLNDSLDPYSFVKESYFQHQQFKLYDGQPPEEEPSEEDDALLDEFMDELDG